MEDKECCKGEGHDHCGCGHDHSHEHGEDEMTTEELVDNNNVLLNTLIDVLIKKNVISEEELRNAIKELEEEYSDDSE